MSEIRPECGNATKGNVYVPRDTALFLIRDSVDRRAQLIHGRLHGAMGEHCAIGCFFTDNPNAAIDTSLIDEVATVNDSLGPNATAKERWQKVSSWLRWKLRILSQNPVKK